MDKTDLTPTEKKEFAKAAEAMAAKLTQQMNAKGGNKMKFDGVFPVRFLFCPVFCHGFHY